MPSDFATGCNHYLVRFGYASRRPSAFRRGRAIQIELTGTNHQNRRDLYTSVPRRAKRASKSLAANRAPDFTEFYREWVNRRRAGGLTDPCSPYPNAPDRPDMG